MHAVERRCVLAAVSAALLLQTAWHPHAAAAAVSGRPALARFINAATHDTQQRASRRCGAGGVHAISKLSKLLSEVAAESDGPGVKTRKELLEHSKTVVQGNLAKVLAFKGHGMWGAFDPRYRGAKIAALQQAACGIPGAMGGAARTAQSAPRARPLVLCEVGFMAGNTALLWLEVAPDATVISFDLGDMPWARSQADALNAAYGPRFRIVYGSSSDTIPEFARSEPDVKCDLAFIDGGKTERLRAGDLRNFKLLARPGTVLVFDEVTTRECVAGTGPRSSCGTAWNGATFAYWQASRDGLIKDTNCSYAEGQEDKDGLCTAAYA